MQLETNEEVKARFSDAFKASPVGIVVENLDGQPLFVNPAFCSMLGFTEEELRNKHCVDFSPQEDAQKDWVLFQQLREGSIDHYQIDKRYFRSDGTTVWGRLTVSLLRGKPSPLVLAMVDDITERKLAEEALSESETRFRSIFRDAGIGMVIVSLDGRYLSANRAFCDYLGYSEQEILGKTIESITLPADWPAFSEKMREALSGQGFQWLHKRCLHKSGRIVYTETSSSVIRDREGVARYFVAQILDITGRKEAEEALSAMTRKLIEAQEQERARIARELHDDISQRLAVLAIDLDGREGVPQEVQSHLEKFRLQVVEIANDVHGLSHELHSSKLELLGVVTAMRSWCQEVGRRQKIDVDFASDVSTSIPPELGLSLLRVLQEALHNATRHSGTQRVEVRLEERSNELHLLVRDSGKGFDVESALRSQGLGLTSMRERVRLLNGRLTVQSQARCGTEVHARVPFNPDQNRSLKD
ncbi:PAS/PAC sensor signal transduction histidine kinase [Candidatus Koribacter versatilis Ellin345]|uniref:PAS/PAC sensor signal transduction histidine kinase n=1 Tax=Koribacter versatilis (strain Ellin345) TaxID=204669 RepID=Q1ITH4_KORVE|nr:PAS domain S-box protein [Candidatus Koribacter versatilis]ABF39826.1 PAS/PAC sensor signal transduction histidine kinase [Candidatus Koribacter versatilis Ellin345]